MTQEGPVNPSELDRKIKLSAFKDDFNHRLGMVLDQCTDSVHSAKDLIFTESMRAIFEFSINKLMLKKKNVSITTLNKESINDYNDQSESALVFLVSAERRNFKNIRRFLTSLKRRGIRKSRINLVVYPQRDIVSQLLVREFELHIIFMENIFDFNIEMVPLADDLLTLFDHNSLKEMFLTKEFKSINQIAQSIQRLQLVYGQAASVVAKGKYACDVMRILERENTNGRMSKRYKQSKIDRKI